MKQCLERSQRKNVKKSIVKSRNKGVVSNGTWNFMTKLKMNFKNKQENNELWSSTGFENLTYLT